MNCTRSLNAYGAQLATLLGTASLLTLANAIATTNRAYAGEAGGMVAQNIPEEVPENVLITGSLIRGTVAVGVPVVNLTPMDFANTGALTTADLFKNFPAADVRAGEVGTVHGGLVERGNKVNIRRLNSPDAPRSLMMVDGFRTPPQGNGGCLLDPSIIPAISLDHIDILVDGASATYGSDAISGVTNIILKRNYDGAQTQLRYTNRVGGGARYAASQLWGRTWDGGQITLSYEWYNEIPTKGNVLSMYGTNFTPWGYDDKTPIGSTSPGIITRGPFPTGAALSALQIGTACGYFNVPASGRPSTPSNCYAVPLGTGRDFDSSLNNGVGPTGARSASTLNWTTFSNDPNFAGPLTPTSGTRNEYNPYSVIPYNAFEERNGGAFTVDQRLTKDISFYGSGYYSNRRGTFHNQSTGTPTANNAIQLFPVPTFNPYYPAGTLCPAAGAQPADCVPTNLRISYDLGIEMPGMVSFYELDTRYQLGLNIALPARWAAQVYYAETYTNSTNISHGAANKNAISAALGWTILPVAASANDPGPGFGSWTKPTSVPYLNLFCDPSVFQCNSPQTLQYIAGSRTLTGRYWINEKGVKSDGPLFDLPGGTVKMAVGADFTSFKNLGISADNTNSPNLTITPDVDAEGRTVWAVFTQINIPVFSDNNAILGFRRLDLEASWRHDQYSDVNGTSNPHVAFNWSPVDDLTIKGAWGNSFRAPAFGEISPTANVMIAGWNLGTLQAAAANTIRSCSAAGAALPAPTSGAGKLQQAANLFNNRMAAAGIPGYNATTGCIDSLTIPDTVGYVQPASTLAGPSGVVADPLPAMSAFADPGSNGITGLIQPGGISTLGGNPQSLPLRQFTGVGITLKPEISTNWSIGFDYAPTNFLRGLDIQATYYVLKINGVLRGFGNPNDAQFANSQLPQAFPSPSDLGCPDLPNSRAPSIPIPANLVPSACAQWVQAVNGLVTNPRAQVDPAALTRVYFVNDGSDFNYGWLKLDGIDWSFSYDWDMGNLGAFNVGAVGTYYLHNKSATLFNDPAATVLDGYHSTVGSANALSVGVSTLPVLQYRARVGWSTGPWNATLFMDYIGHFYHTQSAPPNVNNACVAAGVGVGGGTFPCPSNNYSNLMPPWVSFDLSIGYDTGEDPVNDYLKNLGIQVIFQNILDKHPQFEYKGTNAGGPVSISNPLLSAYGRQISFILTKTW